MGSSCKTHIKGIPARTMSASPITVGLPVYNGENYVAAAIASLQAQTFEDFILIISDNASEDSTGDICLDAARQDERIEYHRQPSNIGAPANYNFTLNRSESEFFMWHAHDDLRAPSYLESAYEAMNDWPDASVVFTRAMLIGPGGEPIREKPRPDSLLADRPHARLRAAITSRHADIVLFGLMRRNLLELTGKHGSFMGGDRLLIAELALLGRFVELEDILFFNRDHPDRYVRMERSRETERLRAAWWDPEKAGKITMPRWQGFFSYLSAVRSHPLSSRDRLLSYGAVARSLFDNRMYLSKQLIREAIGIVRAATARAVARSRS